MEFLKVTKACKIKLVVVGEEKNKKSKSKNLEVGSYLQISFSSAKKNSMKLMQKSLHLSYDVRNEIKKYFKGRRNLKAGCKIINNIGK